MSEDDFSGPPTMSGYLAYKNRIAAGDEVIITRAREKAFDDWLAYQVDDDLAPPPKSAVAHYEDALTTEQVLKDKGADNPVTRARLTGLKLKEFEDKKEPGTRDELLFRAKRAVDSDLNIDRVLSFCAREDAIENGTPILNRVIRAAEVLRDGKQAKVREQLADKTKNRGRER